MDDLQRRRLRRTAKWLHWLLQAILFIVLVVRLVFLYAGTQISEEDVQEMVSIQPLTSASLKVLYAVVWEDVPKVSSLYAYPLPEEEYKYRVWADSIQNHLEKPVAVFVAKDDKVEWLIEHDHLSEANALAESLAVGLIPADAFTKVVSDFKVVSSSKMLPDSSYLTVKCFAQGDRPEKWGYVESSLDKWRAFISALNAFKNDNKYDQRIGWVDNELNVAGTSPQKHNFRLFIHDSLAFESPGFDSTKFVHKLDIGAISEEYQLSESEQQWRDKAAGRLQDEWMLTWGWLDWLSIIKWLAFSFVLALFYHWILKLTKPMQAEVP